MAEKYCIENDFAAQKELAETERHNSMMILEENKGLRARIAKLEEALRFYAEEDYIEWVIKGSPDEDCYEDVDRGEVARRALEEK